MTSETREVAHNQHAHPTNGFYVMIAAILIGLTVLEVGAYYAEESGAVGTGFSAMAIGVLSAAKFLSVVLFYMHLKFDSKLFTGIFIFPAALGTLVIVAMYLMQQGIVPPYRPYVDVPGRGPVEASPEHR
jgi:cytochrome c oxidase subunit 4